jgi:hypothetical protein
VGRKSSITQLDPKVRLAADEALKRGCTIDEITRLLDSLGADVSRSAVGRYAKRYSDFAGEQREIEAVANAFAAEFSTEDNNQGRLMIQLMRSIITKQIMPLMSGEESRADPMAMRLLAAAVKDTTGAAKIEDDRIAAIRKAAFTEAAKAAESEARSAGAGDEVINKIKAKLLGLAT